jgi:hypothetical protein
VRQDNQAKLSMWERPYELSRCQALECAPLRTWTLVLAGQAPYTKLYGSQYNPTGKELKMQKLLAGLILVAGLMLMAVKISADSEPGAIPLLLVVLGMGWYAIAQYRTQSQHK